MSTNTLTRELREPLARLKARLEQDLHYLHEGFSRLDRNSHNADELWAVGIYEKLIARRTSTLQALFPGA